MAPITLIEYPRLFADTAFFQVDYLLMRFQGLTSKFQMLFLKTGKRLIQARETANRSNARQKEGPTGSQCDHVSHRLVPCTAFLCAFPGLGISFWTLSEEKFSLVTAKGQISREGRPWRSCHAERGTDTLDPTPSSQSPGEFPAEV